MTKYVYLFKEGDASMRNLLGGKGAGLAEMTRLGLPVPRGFTITTEACTRYYDDSETIAPEIETEIFKTLRTMEEITGKKLGDVTNPLLVSVRSGARSSMPGMMDTILNLGLTDEVVEAVAKLTDNPRFAWDSYRRFISMFGDVAMHIDKSHFDAAMDEVKAARGVKGDLELNAEDLKEVAQKMKVVYEQQLGKPFPQDPKEQLLTAVKAVFESWNNERAIYYRHMHDIPSSWGTAVNVQEMVYGNMGETSGTGVAFTRNPATGEAGIFGEYLMNAQGEDVVAGIRTPFPITHMKEQMPEVYAQFEEIAKTLEKHYGDMQDMEFTIERGKLFMLQTRNGKRTAFAALQVANDMVKEGLVTKERALMQIDPSSLDTLLHPNFDQEALKAAKPIAKGLPASPGAASGGIVFSAEEAFEVKQSGAKVVLVRTETSPEDIVGMNVSEGILTVRGGMTSHAAVVARGMGKCCVSGCAEVSINEEAETMTIGNKVFHKGDWISLDGATGCVYDGPIATKPASLTGNFATIMQWADEIRELGIRTNADTPKDAKVARDLGAEGIGLVRTEHMFFAEDRIFAFRKMIVAKTVEERRKALAEILPIQQGDFEAIFETMKGLPVTVRLLDPPLHEFLPQVEEDIVELANALNISVDDLKTTIHDLHELNPMLGHRGCRLAVTYPEIAEMQTTAIINAALKVSTDEHPMVAEIMIPLVCDIKELQFVKKVIVKTADKLIKESGRKLEYKVGTMIEIPRAALTADEIATEADFFSFGTNDLTQMTFGLSRDDAGKILDCYYNEGIFESDPTAHLDVKGVGQLMKIATEKSRGVKKNIKLGVCGEHGGDPASISFVNTLGFNYVSCSPYRVPIARLAAAQATISQRK
ncbi:pyruvate, phosphate dikinase [Amygdalobacter nucleatus]|uniref:Pyruvate, phosphate dikinase n=1 Tax=Amygdalobacter nucleatus TaxID=3029274 RepID=A0A133YH66_9FIRM|nr:pyruvate, phosphate dikinase [Amygdalobacter nucleatus]KXB42535.1 pyruvate, phosphate dikinase [Amygdalobacter nucleatus]MDF0486109.1 pyruvate, phosphate dikinase [Amygdalobacter nucleatus]WEG37336.1 pyruvate, phosphate dikinase [Amygdalobacter nucleatus]